MSLIIIFVRFIFIANKILMLYYDDLVPDLYIFGVVPIETRFKKEIISLSVFSINFWNFISNNKYRV